MQVRVRLFAHLSITHCATGTAQSEPVADATIIYIHLYSPKNGEEEK